MPDSSTESNNSNFAVVSITAVSLGFVLYVLSVPFVAKVWLAAGGTEASLEIFYKPLEWVFSPIEDTAIVKPLIWYYEKMFHWLKVPL